jgi:hypothetical protein
MLFHTRLLLVTTAAFALCGLPGVQAQQLSAQDRTFMEDAASSARLNWPFHTTAEII